MQPLNLYAEGAYSYEKFLITEDQFGLDGLTAIIGKNFDQMTANGAGKTGFPKILFYAIFGEDLDGESIEEISNRKLGRGHLVDFTFEDRGHVYRIVRYRDFRPNANSPVQAPEGSRARLKGIRFYIDGVIFGDKKLNGEAASDSDVQKIILAKIGISPELFKLSVLSVQGSEVNFLTKTDVEKKKIISELRDLDAYEIAYADVKNDILETEKKISQAESRVDENDRETKNKEDEIIAHRLKESAFAAQLESEFKDIALLFDTTEAQYKNELSKKPVATLTANIEAFILVKESELEAIPSESFLMSSELFRSLDSDLSSATAAHREVEQKNSQLVGKLSALESEFTRSLQSKARLEAEFAILSTAVATATLGERDLQEKILALSALEIERSSLESDLKKAESALRQLEAVESSLGGQVSLLSADVSLKEASSLEAKSAISIIRTTHSSGMQISENEADLADLAKRTTKSIEESDKALTTAQVQYAQVSAEIVNLKSSDSCPTCSRPWDENHKHERNDKIQALTLNQKSLEDSQKSHATAAGVARKLLQDIAEYQKIPNLEKNIAAAFDASATFENMNQRLVLAKSDLSTAQAASELLGQKLSTVTTALGELQDVIALVSVINEKKASLSQVQQQLSAIREIESEVHAHRAVLNVTERELAATKTAELACADLRNKAISEIKELVKENQLKIQSITLEIREGNLKLTEAKMATQVLAQWKQTCDGYLEKAELLGRQAEAIQNRKNPYTELIESTEGQLVDLGERRKNVAARIETLQEELAYLNYWKAGFGPTGIRSFLSDEVIVSLNEGVREYLSDMFDGAVSIVFESESISQKGAVANKISAKFFQEGRETPWGMLSGGERQRCVIAVDLAISDIAESGTGTRMNLKIMDEPFSFIDGVGQVKCISLFGKIARRKKGFFVVTHDEKFQALCQNSLCVVKKDELSKIVTTEEFRRFTA